MPRRKAPKKWGKLVVFLIVISSIIVLVNRDNSATPKNSTQSSLIKVIEEKIAPNSPPKFSQNSASLFVPYWTLGASGKAYQLPKTAFPSNLETVLYFGIAPTTTGIDKTESGFNNLSDFSQQPAFLVIRMTDEAIISSILNHPEAQSTIIGETIALTKQYGFQGIVLDLEHSVLPTAEVIQQITDLVGNFSEKTRSENLAFAMTLYGDTLYRQRPYNLEQLDNSVDEFLIMAYDFHKSYGEPGPNFPLNKGSLYGYDFKTMIEQFSAAIAPEKLIVIFGLYGYDWSVDSQNRPLKPAKSLTLNQIRGKFVTGCQFSPCTVYRDDLSAETSARYTDNTGQKHVVWFEDSTSVAEKVLFLNSKGIQKIGYWAWGYY